MKPIARYERVLKDLDALARLVREGSLAQPKLDDKISAQRVLKMLEDARRPIRVNYYTFQDAVSPLETEEVEQI